MREEHHDYVIRLWKLTRDGFEQVCTTTLTPRRELTRAQVAFAYDWPFEDVELWRRAWPGSRFYKDQEADAS